MDLINRVHQHFSAGIELKTQALPSLSPLSESRTNDGKLFTTAS